MRPAVDRHQAPDVEVRISLRRPEPRVPEQLLNGPEVGARLQQVRRERVAERMSADAGRNGRLACIATDHAIDAPRRQAASAKVDEQRLPAL
jgi:hypothetical protein